ncbi:MAG: sigma-70 family RNA polymerase sigma factor [Eubacterium sp.]|nr:sigma-70 family RNA polymerase sigma factor [Eubacterium sp.]
MKAVDTYAGTLYRIACTYCRQHADAEDIVQTAFMKLYQTETEFQDEEHIKRWLIRVTVNEARNLCSSFWKKNVTSLESSGMIQPYDFPRPEYSDLYDAVLSLPGKYKIVVHLYYYEDYSVKEIAEILSLKETTVQTQLMRARKQLKIKLKEVWQDEQ